MRSVSSDSYSNATHLPPSRRRRALYPLRLELKEQEYRRTVPKDIPLPLLAPLMRLQGRLEPLVLVARMIRHYIDHRPDTVRFERSYHLVKVFQRADVGINVAIIDHIVCALSAPFRAV